MRYVALLRGINVGGKNKVSMEQLRRHLEDAGFGGVRTYINSGNVVFDSCHDAKTASGLIEAILSNNFVLDDSIIKVLVITSDQLRSIVDGKPIGFGERPVWSMMRSLTGSISCSVIWGFVLSGSLRT